MTEAEMTKYFVYFLMGYIVGKRLNLKTRVRNKSFRKVGHRPVKILI